MSEICVYHARIGQTVPAERFIDGEGLCASCLKGIPLVPEQVAGDMRFNAKQAVYKRKSSLAYYHAHRKAILRRMEAKREGQSF